MTMTINDISQQREYDTGHYLTKKKTITEISQTDIKCTE